MYIYISVCERERENISDRKPGRGVVVEVEVRVCEDRPEEPGSVGKSSGGN